jgi:hypothetical protein
MKFNIGDIVIATPHYAEDAERGLIMERSYSRISESYEYSIHFVNSGRQAWFAQEDVSLIERCALLINS